MIAFLRTLILLQFEVAYLAAMIVAERTDLELPTNVKVRSLSLMLLGLHLNRGFRDD